MIPTMSATNSLLPTPFTLHQSNQASQTNIQLENAVKLDQIQRENAAAQALLAQIQRQNAMQMAKFQQHQYLGKRKQSPSVVSIQGKKNTKEQKPVSFEWTSCGWRPLTNTDTRKQTTMSPTTLTSSSLPTPITLHQFNQAGQTKIQQEYAAKLAQIQQENAVAQALLAQIQRENAMQMANLQALGKRKQSPSVSIKGKNTKKQKQVELAQQQVQQQDKAAEIEKRRKEQFLMFARVLMKYLEQKDPDMHARAKAVIRECAEKNKRKEKGYESVTLSMQTRLKQTVGTSYWERAGDYLQHFLKQKEAEKQRGPAKSAQQQQQQNSTTQLALSQKSTQPTSTMTTKTEKEQFLMFTRVLMKYLEQKDPDMHARAKAVIRECAEKNKRKEKGYESVTLAMQSRLKQTVGTSYWERAGDYLQHFLKQKEAEIQRRKAAAEEREAKAKLAKLKCDVDDHIALVEKQILLDQQAQLLMMQQSPFVFF